MDATIATALITGGVTSLGSVLGFIGTMAAQKKKDLDAHKEATEKFQKSIEEKLEEHKIEYLGQIAEVNKAIRKNSDDISEMRTESALFQKEITIKFANLSEKVNKHNNFMEKLQQAQLDIEVLKNRESVSEHRLADLERINENK